MVAGLSLLPLMPEALIPPCHRHLAKLTAAVAAVAAAEVVAAATEMVSTAIA